MLNPDFRDILFEFCAEQVEFLLVGAYALAVHGYPRATGDIDLWVRCNEENAQHIMTALTRFGAPLANISAEDFQTPGIVFQIGVAPHRIDITTQIDGIGFEEAWAARKSVELAGLTIFTLSREHLLRNKRASGRPKDLADVAWLESNETS